MTKKTFWGVYSAPDCEVSAKEAEAVLCESPEGLTEDFGGFEDFTW